MIIWRGLGIVVLLIAVVGAFVGALIVHLTGLRPPFIGIVYLVAEILAGGAIWLFAKRIESQPGRVFIDKVTGREITVGRSAGSLFFIPTRYWAFIVPSLFVLLEIQIQLKH